MTELVSSFTQFGWAVTLLALVLIGVGTALALYFKADLKRRDREFEAREKERSEFKEHNKEQQIFIRKLAQQATAAQIKMSQALEESTNSQIKATQAMSEMIQSLSVLNENYRLHREKDMEALVALRSEHQEILHKVEVRQ